MKRVICSKAMELLRNIPDDQFSQFTSEEKKLYGAACNSSDPQMFLLGCSDTLSAYNIEPTEAFENLINSVIADWDFSNYS